ncbi:hypothetical protein DVA86_22645 [Streptomyces armeniacus]|uniref:FUSC family protein n=2 Tax=Streptomyces armeniacus TaxID=83291 RepID=A0A345XTR0_9ACTN|nr:hypothetical protein DVA86_22645 [Streptomyces armeniacus]
MSGEPEAADHALERTREWWRRAVTTSGRERDSAEMVVKSALAATISWVIAYEFMNATSPAFAPFSAVWMMQATVYRSLVQSLAHVGAVTVGVALQGVFGLLAGTGPAAFALVALAALTIGQWRRLGAQGSQVATAAFFAFSTYVAASNTDSRMTQLGTLVSLVLVGSAVGVVVNLLVLPPMRHRGAERALRDLAGELQNLLADMHPVLREEDVLDDGCTSAWLSRVEGLDSTARQARAAVGTARESLFYNPRQKLPRNRGHNGFEGYEGLQQALERVTHQLASLVRSLHQWQRNSGGADPHDREFLRCYSEFLARLDAITQEFAELDQDHLAELTRNLCALTEEAGECRDEVSGCAARESLPLTETGRPYGILLVEASRLTEEFEHTCRVLRRALGEPEPKG